MRMMPHLRATAEDNGGNGKFNTMENKVGYYCYRQNCYGDKHSIGWCWMCVELAMRGGVPSSDAGVEPGAWCMLL